MQLFSLMFPLCEPFLADQHLRYPRAQLCVFIQ